MTTRRYEKASAMPVATPAILRRVPAAWKCQGADGRRGVEEELCSCLGSSSRFRPSGAIGENPTAHEYCVEGSGYVPIRVRAAAVRSSRVRLLSRRFVRRHDGRIVAGVAVGLGDALDVDVNVVRCGFLVLTLAGGVALSCTAPPGCSCARTTTDLPRGRSDAIATAAFRVGLSSASCCWCARSGPGPATYRVAARRGDDRLALLSTRPRNNDSPDPRDWPFLDRSHPTPPTRSRCSSGRAAVCWRGSSPDAACIGGRVGRVQFPSLS